MFTSLWGGFPRILTLAAIGYAFYSLQLLVPLLLGPVGTPFSLGASIVFFGLALGDAALRILQPRIDAQAAAALALSPHTSDDVRRMPAAMVYLARSFLVGVVLLIVALKVGAAEPPPAAALPLLPLVKAEQTAQWPDMPMPSLFGAQFHKESCITERHPKCWNIHSMLKTSRERGYGLGQFTIAYNQNGSVRFDALQELVTAYPQQMAGVTWAVYEQSAQAQIRATILKDKQSYAYMQRLGFRPGTDALKAMASGYNGGNGAARSDQAVCRGTPGCDPTRWDGHVATTSLKQKTAIPGYGKPFFQINRDYANLLVDPKPVRARYVPYLEL